MTQTTPTPSAVEPSSSPPVNRMAIAALALAGVFLAGYLLLYKLRVLGSIACGTGACERVQSSPWAVFLGIPVPAWGVGGYASIFIAALLGIQPAWIERRAAASLLAGLSTFAFGFSVYLSAIEAFVLNQWCRWCIGSAVIATLIFLFSLPELKRLLRRETRG